MSFDTIDHINITVFIHVAPVAGMHPAVDHRFCSLLGFVPIAHHHDVAADRDLTNIASWDGLVVSINDLGLKPERYPSGRAVSSFRSGGADVVLGQKQRPKRRKLGHPVSLPKTHAG